MSIISGEVHSAHFKDRMGMGGMHSFLKERMHLIGLPYINIILVIGFVERIP